MKTVAVLGCGNMAQALVKGWASESLLKHYCYTPSRTRAEILAREVKGEVLENLDSINHFDVYLIACKPQQISELAQDIKGKIPKKSLVISLLAGVTTTRLSELLEHQFILRVMPNTPSMIGKGVSALYYTEAVDAQTKNFWQERFSQTGLSVVFDNEDKIDVISPFSGSGPAYIFEFARIFIEKMIIMGIDEETAHKMIVQTFVGASELMAHSSESPETLRNNVTSKKGMTYEALEVFKNFDLANIFSSAIESAYLRGKELSKN